ncbi:MAG TPA: hypothetical protein VI541_02670 [Actinomycetota bacterium]|nr:hypothetical protein [Actinomycetota bacterium]
MKSRRWVTAALAVTVAFSLISFLPVAIANHAGTNVMFIRGISNISNQCEYEWFDNDTATPGIQPVRDILGIPKPKMYANEGPRCRDGNPNLIGIQPVACSLERNTGTYHAPDQPSNNLLAGETGLEPPCRGDITASDIPGASGCVSLGSAGQSDCGINSSTWYYGYCGQTYGGAKDGIFTYGGQTWLIERMGFTRGRGAWEFSGRMHLTSDVNHKTTFRYYLAAAPDQTSQLLGCDVTHNITSVLFTGTVIVPAPPEPKAYRTEVGWHWCDDDFGPNHSTAAPFKAGTLGENC